MKKLALLLVLILPAALQAADAKLTALSQLAQADNDDLIYVVDDANGTPASYKIPREEFLISWAGSTNITTLGTIASGTWQGTTIAVDQGGTGATSLSDGFVLLGNATGAIQALDVTTDGGIIIGDGTTDPVVLDVGSSTAITILGTVGTGTWEATDVGVEHGGTGRSTSTTAYGLIAAGTTATGAHQTLAAGLTTQILVGGGAAALPSWGTDIPTAVTIGSGYIYRAGGTDVPVGDGGLGTDVSAFTDGLVGVATGAVTDIDSEGELETALGSIDIMVVATDDFSSANLATALSDETGTGGGFVRANSATMDSPTFTTAVTATDLLTNAHFTHSTDWGDIETDGSGNVLIDADNNVTITGDWNFGGATNFELPNSATPTLPNLAGEVALDTDLLSGTTGQGILELHSGVQLTYIVGTIDTPGDDEIPKYDSTTGTIQWETDAGAAGGDAWSDPVDSDILPTGNDNTFDIGSSGASFAEGWFDTMLYSKAITLTDEDASPTGAGELKYDNGITGLDDGALVWYDDDEIRTIVDIDASEGVFESGDDGHVVTFNWNAGAAYFDLQAPGAASGDITDVWTDDTGDVSALTAGAGDTLDAGGADSTVPWEIDSTGTPTTEGEALWRTDVDNLLIGDGAAGTVYMAKGASDGDALAGDSASGFFDTGTVEVTYGGTGAASLSDGFVLLGNATGAIQALDVTTDGGIIIGDGTTDPVVLDVGSSTAITILGTVGTGTWEATDVGVEHGGTGRSTSTTAYGLIAAGTTATGAHQTLAAGGTDEMLVGGGAAALPIWTTATGTGAPVRADSPSFSTELTATDLIDVEDLKHEDHGEIDYSTGNAVIDDGVAVTNWNLTTPTITTSATVTDGTWIGISGGETITFDGTGDDIQIDGAQVGIGVDPTQKFQVGSATNTDRISLYHDDTDAYMEWDDGVLRVRTTETDQNGDMRIYGNGTGYAALRLYDEDDAESVVITSQSQQGYIFVSGTGPSFLNLQHEAEAGVKLFTSAGDNETPELFVYGYRTGDQLRNMQIAVGIDAVDTASFDGVSNYLFDGTIQANTSLILTGADADPTLAGQIRYDSTITGLADGGLVWYDQDEIRRVVDIDASEGDFASGDDAKLVRYVWNAGNGYFDLVTAAGGGDMSKSTYDVDTDNDIDQAAGGTELDSSGVTDGQLFIGNSTGNVWALGTIGEGLAIDVTNGSGTVSVAFDPTEMTGARTWNDDTTDASFAWTFGLNAGTDPQITFGDGIINATQGAWQVSGNAVYYATGTDVAVTDGGTGVGTLDDGFVLLGNAANAIQTLDVTGDGSIIIGDGTTDPTTLAAFTSSTGQLKHESGGIEADISAIADGGILVGTGAGTMAIRASALTAGAAGFFTHELGGLEADVSGYTTGLFGLITGTTTDIDTPGELETAAGLGAFFSDYADDGDQATMQTTLGLGTGDSPQFTAVNIGDASDTTLSRNAAGILQVESNVIPREIDVPGMTSTTPKVIYAFAIHDIDDGMDDIAIQFPRAMTISKVTAMCIGGTNVVGRLYEVDGDGDDSDAVGVETSDWTFTTTETEDTSFNNAALDAGDYLQWDTTSVSGSVTCFRVTVEGYET